MKKLKSIASAMLAIVTSFSPITSVLFAGTVTTGVFLATSDHAQAQTVRMNNRQSARSVSRNTRQAARQTARNPYMAPAHVNRNARQASRQVSRNTRQSARQITRRHFYALPAGYRWVTFGAYRYCYHGGLYYYPYMYGGRTVYIQVNVSASNPTPPPSTQVIVNVN